MASARATMTSSRRSRPSARSSSALRMHRRPVDRQHGLRHRVVALVARRLRPAAASAARSRGSAGRSRSLSPDGFSPSSGLSQAAKIEHAYASSQRTRHADLSHISVTQRLTVVRRAASRGELITRRSDRPHRDYAGRAITSCEGPRRTTRSISSVGRSSSNSGRSCRQTMTSALAESLVDGERKLLRVGRLLRRASARRGPRASRPATVPSSATRLSGRSVLGSRL